MKKLGSEILKNEIFLKREDYHKNILRKITSLRDTILLGGGKSAIDCERKNRKVN